MGVSPMKKRKKTPNKKLKVEQVDHEAFETFLATKRISLLESEGKKSIVTSRRANQELFSSMFTSKRRETLD